MVASNYRQVNAPDKGGDAKLVNVYATGNQIRVNTASAGQINI